MGHAAFLAQHWIYCESNLLHKHTELLLSCSITSMPVRLLKWTVGDQHQTPCPPHLSIPHFICHLLSSSTPPHPFFPFSFALLHLSRWWIARLHPAFPVLSKSWRRSQGRITGVGGKPRETLHIGLLYSWPTYDLVSMSKRCIVVPFSVFSTSALDWGRCVMNQWRNGDAGATLERKRNTNAHTYS